MAVNKIYVCDLCGAVTARDQLMRFGVRSLDDRPEDAENVDAGPCCLDKPVSELWVKGMEMRQEVTDGR
jgi:hypothetical protein